MILARASHHPSSPSLDRRHVNFLLPLSPQTLLTFASHRLEFHVGSFAGRPQALLRSRTSDHALYFFPDSLTRPLAAGKMSANKTSAVADEPIDVLFALQPKFDLLDFAGPVEVFTNALHDFKDDCEFSCLPRAAVHVWPRQATDS